MTRGRSSQDGELKKFTDLFDKLIRVPHANIKDKLEAEKAKKRKKKEGKVKHNDH